MFIFAQNTILNLLLMLTLSIPGLQPVFQGEPVEVVQKRFNDGLEERNVVIDSMRKLEAEHRRIVTQITNLKRQNTNALTVRLALESLLRDAQRVSEQLAQKQEEIRVMDNRLTAHRAQLLSSIEGTIQHLESALRTVPANERARLVRELNQLRSERAKYSTPLPEAPSVEKLDAALTLAARADSPDDLHAAADELEDTEDKLRRRLAAVETRLEELKASKRLVRRAQGFSREERFFEETDRERVIARYERTTSTATKTPTPQPSTSNNANTPAGPPEANDGQNNFAPSAGFDGDSDTLAGSPSREASDPLTSSDGFPREAPMVDSVFETRESIIIQSASDPSRAIGGDSRTAEQPLDNQIRSLEEEKARLKNQADLLNKRATQLRTKAKTR